ncbi:Putative gamma-glutamyltransferase YwrD [bacterium HR39]|nr:Putative gamma-glutamyltransferase YwrD [bacterium HR39]
MRDFHLPGRSTVYATGGMAATSHPLSTLAALDVLRRGGNAVDAAIAACAVQCVVEPQSTGIGGDCFALYAPPGGGVIGINGSGWAPAAVTVERLRAAGLRDAIPATSPHAVTVPGAVAAWEALQKAYGRLDLGAVLEPAIRYARDGFPVLPRVGSDWERAQDRLRASEAARAFYLPGDRPPAVGDVIRLPRLAHTLEAIAKGGAEAFYRGEPAAAMVETLCGFGGLHREEDFAEYAPEWVQPIHTTYRGVRVFECPPNGQGFVALLMLNILEGFDLAALDPHGADRFHLEAEATKLAFRDRDALLADPRHAPVPVEELLSKGYAAKLRALIDRERALRDLPPPLLRGVGNTVYVSVVDRDLGACSFINSLYDSFGSGLACPKTGVLFHCRGRAFRLDSAHPNAIGPRRRPMHTIIPGLAFRDGELWACFGVMGADYQPVGHVHLLTNLVDFGMDPQEALDSPRVMAWPKELLVERGVTPPVRAELARRGHEVVETEVPHGGGQCILIDRRRGVLVGGSDPRKDGVALGL